MSVVRARPLATLPRDLARARSGGAFGERERGIAAAIVADVRRRGDAAVLASVRRFDDAGARRRDLLVERSALKRAARAAPRDMRRALDAAHERIRAFHELQRPARILSRDPQARAELVPTPLRRVGALVPRGASAYPSTALMTGVPARVAGVGALVAVSPMGRGREIDPVLAYALTLVDADALYRAGGAAGVGALAFGTASVAAVDKIVGPGNAFTTAAKWVVSTAVGIDGLEGPSELVAVASRGADTRALALDLLAQAEHGSGAFALLISDDDATLRTVAQELRSADASLRARVFLYRARNVREAAAAANDAAPEHVLLTGEAAAAEAGTIDRAGAVFVGARSAVAFGDYVAGTNHCLPTGGTARWSSALRVADFVRWTARVRVRSPRILARTGPAIARHERMRYHAESMEARV